MGTFHIASRHANLDIIGLDDNELLPIETIKLATNYPVAFSEPKKWHTLENFIEKNLRGMTR